MGQQIADILVRIIEQRCSRLKSSTSASRRLALEKPHQLLSAVDHPFLKALSVAKGGAVIAEIKLGSPRLGSLVDTIDPIKIARTYRAAGATALSVVVEPDFFFGSYELLTECKAAAQLPAIAKDFIVDPRQLDFAAASGADAILLIASLYHEQELADYANQARSLGLVPLIETHSRDDLDKLGSVEWELIGVNNRDLTSFEVNLQQSLDLIPRLPSSSIKVAESGISTPQELLHLSQAGFDAFLIGESLLLADDPEAKLRELVSLVGDESLGRDTLRTARRLC